MLGETTSGIIFMEFSFSAYTLCTNLFGIVMVGADEGNTPAFPTESRTFLLQSTNSGDVPAFIVITLYILVMLFIYCAVGELVPTESAKFCEVVYNSTDWYDCPPGLRRHIVMIIRQAQQPLHLKGLGLMAYECSLENYTNVSRVMARDLASKFILGFF